MPANKIEEMKFMKVYPLLVNKAVRKGRTKEETDACIRWLTGYDQKTIDTVPEEMTYGDFFAAAPAMNPLRSRITGKICGIRIEEIDDSLYRDMRILDKMVDELAKGRALERILREE